MKTRPIVFVAAAIAFALLAPVARAQEAVPPAKTLKALDPGLMDTSVDPCVDLYRYSCGGWLKQNPIPADEASYGRSDEIVDENRLVLKAILEKAAAGGAARSANEQKIGDYYHACMDVAAIDKAGLAPLQPLLGRIAALQSKDQFPELAGYFDGIGVNTFFALGSDQDFKDATQEIAVLDQLDLGLPEKGYYLRQDAKSAQLRAQYQAYIAQTLALLGEPQPQATAEAATVLRLETALAGFSLSAVEQRNPEAVYHKLDLAKFDGSTPAFNFVRFLRAAQVPPVTVVNVTAPAYFQGLNQLLAATSLEEWKTWLRWALIRHLPRTALPAALDEASFDFYGKVVEGQPQQKARWKRCIAATDTVLGDALGQVYVEQRFSPQDKERTLVMTQGVEAAMGRDIEQLVWMSPATKQRAQEKLHDVANKIGYPNKWRDYSTFVITPDDALANGLNGVAFEEKRQLGKIGKPVDRGEWSMSPPTVNAYYSAQMNDINFPAGILQPPFYDPTQDDAVNYGDGGGIIGHELTHGFDDEGRQFDGHGNLKAWWTPADEKQFNERAACVVNEYDQFVGVDDLHVNGKLTLGENIADLGGLKLAFLAYVDQAQKSGVDLQQKGTAEYGGLTPDQQFFVAYGQAWCQNNRPENLRLRMQSDPHSPEEFRTNGVVVNLPEFQRAFACKTGQPMAPAKRCVIW
jgi:putative endopeptidase